MERSRTTVVALVGADLATPHRVLASVSGMPTAAPDLGVPALERAAAVRGSVASSSSPYFLHDADPLRSVAEAWELHYDERSPIGTLEVAVAETIAAWRAGRVELPDYYLVLEPERWGPTLRHFYLGWLAAQAPARVIPVPAGTEAVIQATRSLPSGRWWPEMDRLVQGVERTVPDVLSPELAVPPSAGP